MRRRIHACHMMRRIHACTMRRRIQANGLTVVIVSNPRFNFGEVSNTLATH